MRTDMDIKQHKALVAANIEDPIVGEWIEVSSDGERWHRGRFTILTINCTYWIDTPGYDRGSWPYARRPASETNTPHPTYGWCVKCGEKVVSRERRPNGYDTCAIGHYYPSSETLDKKPASETKPKRLKDDEPWEFYTADFSLKARGKSNTGTVTMVRGIEGHKAWMSLSEEDAEKTPLFMTGVGDSFESAIADAENKICDWQNSLERRPE